MAKQLESEKSRLNSMNLPAESPDQTVTNEHQGLLGYEKSFWSSGFSNLAGVDEVGRGALAGPVVAAAVILSKDTVIDGATDSKRLNARSRKELTCVIHERAKAVALGAASVREIDQYNIIIATAWAMNRAISRLYTKPDHIVLDGLPMKSLNWEHDAVVGGDGLVHSISCASIVAKFCRDQLMVKLSKHYPGYGWDHNMGYGTQEHRDALGRIGHTPHHRQSFLGIQYGLDI